MKEPSFIHPPPVYIEIGRQFLRALREDEGLEIPLEREGDGQIRNSAREKIILSLRKFAGRKWWQPRARAYCAIGASGVLLRRLSLPASEKEQLQKLLPLQIESEFPLPPDELAWGFARLANNSAAGKQDVLVAAVKKAALEDYSALLTAGGLDPVFTVAALARSQLCQRPGDSYAVMEIDSRRAELAVMHEGIPTSLRILPLASNEAFANAVAKALGSDWNGRKIFVTGGNDEFAAAAAQLPGAINFVPVKTETGPGRSSAVLGLKRCVEQNGRALPLTLRATTKSATGKIDLSRPEIKFWLKRAIILLAVLLILPYAEAILLKPLLARRLARLRAEQPRLTTIDRELDFLESLKQTQPPYLDALYVFAKSAPPGARIELLTMNRRGEVTLRGSMQNGQLVTDFREKLIGSGFFSNVTVEEQSPSPDRQKVNIRLAAQWKPAPALAGLSIGPTPEEIEIAKTNKTAQAAGAFPPGMPPMMPPDAMPSPRVLRR